METFYALLVLCAGYSPVTGEFPSQRAVARSFDLRPNKRLSKQLRGWRLETPSCSLWRHCIFTIYPETETHCSVCVFFFVPFWLIIGRLYPYVNSFFYYACQTRDIYRVLPYTVDFKAPDELWNLPIKTVRSKCNFTWNKGPVNIWN